MSMFQNLKAKTALIGASVIASPAFAALDTTGVQTSIAAAETDGLAVGAMVIATVAAMAVVGVVIAMVKKL